jgi:hypothetical protein
MAEHAILTVRRLNRTIRQQNLRECPCTGGLLVCVAWIAQPATSHQQNLRQRSGRTLQKQNRNACLMHRIAG